MTDDHDALPAEADDVTPPWHAYCGCYGCRAGNAIGRKALNQAKDQADG